MAYSQDLRASAIDRKRAKNNRAKYPLARYTYTNNTLSSYGLSSPTEELSKRDMFKLGQTVQQAISFTKAHSSPRPTRNPYAGEQSEKRIAMSIARSNLDDLRDQWDTDDSSFQMDQPLPVASQLALHDAVDLAVNKFEEVQFTKMVKGEYEVVRLPEMEEFVLV